MSDNLKWLIALFITQTIATVAAIALIVGWMLGVFQLSNR
jgi:hypothetical protein